MAASSDDLYAALGVARGANKDDLRRAYRKLARQYHPDVRPGDKAAEERFKQITAAYDVLGDDKKRKLYDEFGPMGLREGFDAAQARAYQQFGGHGGHGGQAGPAAGGFDFGDMFGDLFGGGRQRQRGQDLQATVDISLADAVLGTELTLNLPQQVRCQACDGSGAEAGTQPARCGACRGSGQLDMGGMRARCPHCGGKGQSAQACRSCHGQGTTERAGPVTVRVPAGVGHGSKLRVAGRGAQGPRGAGDLLLEMRIKPHPWFRKEGLDLVVRLPLTVAEAMLGGQVEVPTPQGSVKLRVPPGAQANTRLRLKGRGVRRGSKQGDLYAELEVRVPAEGTAEQQQAARALDEAYPTPVRAKLHF